MKTKLDRIEKLRFPVKGSLMDAIKKMDAEEVKLLLVFEKSRFRSVLSIGDIQRAIIRNVGMDVEVGSILRNQITLCYSDEPQSTVKNKMLKVRAECMPIIDRSGELVDVLFWQDAFPDDSHRETADLNVPVVIMAGGKGTRLRPLTNVLPKPLMPIGRKTILEMIMDRFISAGCRSFHLSLNYKASMIRHYFETLASPDFEVEYFVEEKPLGTAGSLQLLKGKIKTAFFVSNCDILIDQDVAEIFDYHKANRNEITLVSVLKHLQVPYGTVETAEDGLLQSITEKPEFVFKVNSGVYILEPHLLDEIPGNQLFHITDLVEGIRQRNGRVGVFPVSEGAWTDIGTWSEYIKAIEHEQS
jgi:dTDP-glucose pyrophosphorylase